MNAAEQRGAIETFNAAVKQSHAVASLATAKASVAPVPPATPVDYTNTLTPALTRMLDDVVVAVGAFADVKLNVGLAKLHDELLALAKARASTDAELIARMSKLATQLSAFEKRLAVAERKIHDA